MTEINKNININVRNQYQLINVWSKNQKSISDILMIVFDETTMTSQWLGNPDH